MKVFSKLVLMNLASFGSALILKMERKKTCGSVMEDLQETDRPQERGVCKIWVYKFGAVQDLKLPNIRTDFCGPSLFTYVLMAMGAAKGHLSLEFEQTGTMIDNKAEEKFKNKFSYGDAVLGIAEDLQWSYGEEESYRRPRSMWIKHTFAGKGGEVICNECQTKKDEKALRIAGEEAVQHCKELGEGKHGEFWKVHSPLLHKLCAKSGDSKYSKLKIEEKVYLYITATREKRMEAFKSALTEVLKKEQTLNKQRKERMLRLLNGNHGHHDGHDHDHDGHSHRNGSKLHDLAAIFGYKSHKDIHAFEERMQKFAHEHRSVPLCSR